MLRDLRQLQLVEQRVRVYLLSVPLIICGLPANFSNHYCQNPAMFNVALELLDRLAGLMQQYFEQIQRNMIQNLNNLGIDVELRPSQCVYIPTSLLFSNGDVQIQAEAGGCNFLVTKALTP